MRMAGPVHPVDASIGRDHGVVALAAVAAMLNRILADRAVRGDAGIFRCFTDRVLNGVAQLMQSVAVMSFGLRRRSQQGETQQADGSGSDAA